MKRPPVSEPALPQQQGHPRHRHALPRSNADFAHGNFANYYGVRTKSHQLVEGGEGQARTYPNASSPDLDPRVEAFLAWFKKVAVSTSASSDIPSIRRILDVGCNDGTIGLQVASRIPETYFLSGVDIDPTLVLRARARARAVAEAQSNPLPDGDEAASQALNATHRAGGALYQTEFRCADWVYGDQESAPVSDDQAEPSSMPHSKKPRLEPGEEGFDLILALSVSKWIHIHNQDIGLLRFLLRLSNSLRPGGLLLFEPQPYRSYEQAKRNLPREKRHRFKHLRLREEDFPWLLGNICGLQEVKCPWHNSDDPSSRPFHRPLLLYRKPRTSSAATGTAPMQLLLRILNSLPGGEERDSQHSQGEASQLSPSHDSTSGGSVDQADSQPPGAANRHLPLPFPWVSRDSRDRGQRVNVLPSRTSTAGPPDSHDPAGKQTSSVQAVKDPVPETSQYSNRSLQFRPRQVAKRPRKK